MKPKIYQLDAGETLLASSITGKDGGPLGVNGPRRFSSVEVVCVHVPLLDSDADILSESDLPDAIGCSFDIVVSDRLKNIITSFKVDSSVRFTRAEIVNRADDVVSNRFWLCNTEKWHCVLDVGRSNASLYGNGMIEDIGQWVLKRESLPDLDFWCAHAERWMASHDLASKIEHERFSNLAIDRQQVR